MHHYIRENNECPTKNQRSTLSNNNSTCILIIRAHSWLAVHGFELKIWQIRTFFKTLLHPVDKYAKCKFPLRVYR